MKGLVSKLLPLAAMFVLVGVGAAGAATAKWTGVTQVTVKWANGSLPPSHGNPRTLNFKTTAQLAKVKAALNANHIARYSGKPDPGMCAGGTDVTITIAQQAKRTKMTAYLCGTKTYGNVGGNVKGFVKAVGLKA